MQKITESVITIYEVKTNYQQLSVCTSLVFPDRFFPIFICSVRKKEKAVYQCEARYVHACVHMWMYLSYELLNRLTLDLDHSRDQANGPYQLYVLCKHYTYTNPYAINIVKPYLHRNCPDIYTLSA